MKSRIVVFLVAFVVVALLGTERLSAQEFSTSVDPIYLDIDANQSSGIRKSFNYTVVFNNSALHHYNDIQLFVKLNEDIANGDGGVINPSKIKIKLNSIVDGPRSGQIKSTTIALSRQAQKVIDGSIGAFNRIIVPAGGDTWTFQFEIIIDAVDLKGLENGLYPLKLDFALSLEQYRFIISNLWFYSNATSIGSINVLNYAPSFGLEVNANATLDFTSPEHFTMQVENEPNSSWIDVVSKNSDYFIKVKTNNPNFELIRNDSGVSGDATIPVDVVNVELQSAGSGTSQGPKTLSSTNAQTLFIGTKNKNTQKLPVRYFIRKTEAEKLATKTSGEYKAILTYTLEPN